MDLLSRSPTFADTITIRDLAAQATIGEDRWGKARAQPIRLSIFLQASLIHAAKSDDVVDSIHYGLLCKEVLRLVDGKTFSSLYELVDAVADHTLTKNGAETVTVVAEALNQFLMASSLGVSLSRGKDGIREVAGPDQFFVKDLQLPAIIGINPRERELKQIVIVNITFHSPRWDPSKSDWHVLSEELTKTIETSSYHTLEALATQVAQVACNEDGAAFVTVLVQKPSALAFARSSGVEITRTKAFFDETAVAQQKVLRS